MLSRRIDWVVCYGVVGVDDLMTDAFFLSGPFRGIHILDLLSTLRSHISDWTRNIWRLEILWGFIIFCWGHILHYLIIWAWRYWVVFSHLFHHFYVRLDGSRLCDTFRIWFIGQGFGRLIFCLVT